MQDSHKLRRGVPVPGGFNEELAPLDDVNTLNISEQVNVSDAASSQPVVLLFRMQSEISSFYVSRTVATLQNHRYRFQVIDAFDGKVLGASGIQQASGLLFDSKLTLPQQGIWASHVAAWHQAAVLGSPVISLEADTAALGEWDIDPRVYAEYDILFLHSHNETQKPCEPKMGIHARQGFGYWYATGAMLFTNRRPEEVWQELRYPIDLPIDWWLNKMWSEKRLRIASLCPNKFHQYTDHASTNPATAMWTPANFQQFRQTLLKNA